MAEEKKNTHEVRGWFVGDAGVGISSLLLREGQNEFVPYSRKVAIDFIIRTYDGTVRVGEKTKAHWWEFEGNKRFKSYHGISGHANVIFLVYDVTNHQSFENIKKWKSEIDKFYQGRSSPEIVLIANKSDRFDERAVEKQEGQALATKLGILSFFETSAKTGENVAEVFQEGARLGLKAKGIVIQPAPKEEKSWWRRLFGMEDTAPSQQPSPQQSAASSSYSSQSLQPSDKKKEVAPIPKTQAKLVSEQKSNKKDPISVKVRFVGDSKVGMSSLIRRGVDGAFETTSTIGIDFKIKDYNEAGENIQAQFRDVHKDVWERGGDKFKDAFKLIDSRGGAQVIVLIYDATSKQSFLNITARKAEIEKCARDHSAQMILIGNKYDEVPDIEVEREEGQKLAKEFGIPFFETSAKTGQNVNEAFQECVRLALKAQGIVIQPAAPPKEEKSFWSSWFGKSDVVAPPVAKPVVPAQQPVSSSSVSSSSYNALSPQQSVQKSGDVKKESKEVLELRAQLSAEKAKSEQLAAQLKEKPVGFQAEAKKERENKLQPQDQLTVEERIIQIKAVINVFEGSQVEGGAAVPVEGEIEVPSGVKCSLSSKVMSDPVIVKETGQVCERAKIEEYFKKHPEKIGTLIPAAGLKEVIDEWKEWAGFDDQPGLDDQPGF